MGAIWHDAGLPGFLGVPPSFSFHDFGQIEAPSPLAYAEARGALLRIERRLGAEWYRHNAVRARELWLLRRPWWLGV